MISRAHPQKISGDRQINLLLCPMKGFRYWPRMSTTTTDGNYIKNFCQSVQKQRREGKREEK